MKRFNTTGICIPNKHYMVDISDRVAQIKVMVEEGDYFCINRGRQYGKTTTLAALRRALASEYTVANLDFQALSHADFQTEGTFASAFARELLVRHSYGSLDLPNDTIASLESLAAMPAIELKLATLFSALALWNSRSDKPVVLIIDEADNATNNQVFLDFLAQLRLQYLTHEDNPGAPAFQSVILASVTDIKHLKTRIRQEDQHKVNSPWNIAADFDVNMSFSHKDVAGMLADYEAEHSTGMDVDAVAQEVVDWTGGYPFLVSRLCQLIDKHGFAWNRSGVDEAVKALLAERNTLFESLMGKLETFPELRSMLYGILMEGRRLPYSADNEQIGQLEMYGFVRRSADNSVVLFNRIFETRLYDLFILDEKLSGNEVYERGDLGRSRVTVGDKLLWEEVV
ncbi:MAG: ATP-binding protein [Atopobiaceae bacterium]|nr:ATP-binding protein [Atopobiaceae bacterium]